MKRNRRNQVQLFLLFLSFSLYGQVENTLGLLHLNKTKSFPGYNLIYPNNQSSVFLIDQCGEVVNEWTDDVFTAPGAVARLTPEGNLLKAKSSGEFNTPSFGAGGSGGVIEIFDWDNNLLSRRVIRDSIYRQHHDIEILPNGNVVCIVYERKFLEDIVAAGFDTISNNQTQLWFDCIFELSPDLDSIVWEWHSWDHLIQDFDPTKNNYGVVEDHPERFDINYQEFAFGRQDFMHSNAIDYNEDLDQLLLSVRNFHEVWIVDRSTSIEEAASSEGGISGKGGDLLYRWGNPATYNAGDENDQKLLYQHDSKWIKDEESKYFGQLMIFNNMLGEKISVGQLISPIYDSLNHVYLQNGSNHYLPEEISREVSHPDSLKNDSTHASSIQLLENGNFLICAAVQGRLFELTEEEEPVWEYVVPLLQGEQVPQGETISLSLNFTNQVRRYPIDFNGFEGKDLTPLGFIELNPNEDFCTITNIDELLENYSSIKLLQNPVDKYLEFTTSDKGMVFIFNQYGEKVISHRLTEQYNSIDLSLIDSGVYFLVPKETNMAVKFIKL